MRDLQQTYAGIPRAAGRTPRHTRRLRSVLAAAAALTLLAACGSDDSGGSGDSSDAYDVAVIGTMSGPIGPGFLTPEVRGFQTYVDAVNRRGGVNGKKINVDVYDDKADAATAVTAIQQVTSSNAIVAFGSPVAAPAEAEVPFAEQAKMPLVVGAMSTKYIEPARPYLFATDFPHEASAVIQSNFAQQLMTEAKTTAPRVATINDIAPTNFAQLVEKSVGEFGGTVVVATEHQPGTTDFTAETAKIADAHPDIIISQSIPSEIIAIAKALRQRGVTAPIVTEYVAADDSVFQQLEDPNFYAPRAIQFPGDSQTMMSDAEAAGYEDDATTEFFSHGYLNGMLLEQALKECGADCDRESLRDALEGITELDTQGLTGPAGFSPTKHWLISSATMYQWDATEQRVIAVGDYITPDESAWLAS